MEEARAVLRYARVTPRKARQIVDLIRGRRVEEALQILQFIPRRAAPMVAKLLRSAIANAEQKNLGDVDELVVAQAYVDQGPALKRYKAGPMGRAMPRKKYTSHITVVLRPQPRPGASR